MKSKLREVEPEKRKSLRRSFYEPPPAEDYTKNYRRLAAVIAIAIVFITGQIIGGTIARSIAIISDAIHLVSDLIGFVFSIVFLYLSKKRMDKKVSFGYHRMELLGALANIAIVWFLIILVVIQATSRIINKDFVQQPLIMVITASCGVAVNILLYKVLHGGATHSHGLMNDHHHHHHHHQLHEHQSKTTHQEQSMHTHLLNESQKDYNKTKESLIQKAINEQNERMRLESNQSTQSRINSAHQHEHVNQQQKQHKHSLNCHHEHGEHGPSHVLRQSIGMKAAVIHALSDLIQSVGVLASALVIYFLGSQGGEQVTEWNAWHLFDPLATYLFSILSLAATLPVIKNCYFLIMEATPEYINLDELKQQFQELEGVVDVHDIHVWDLKPGKTIIIAHVIAENGMERAVLTDLTDLCRVKRIFHSTFQVEEKDLKNEEEYIACHHDIHDH